jgi:hypothetical protein
MIIPIWRVQNVETTSLCYLGAQRLLFGGVELLVCNYN